MSVRDFAGSGTQDQLYSTSIGGLTTLADAGNTYAALIKRTGNGADEMIVGAKNSGGAALIESLVIGGGGSSDQVGYQANSGGTYLSGISYTTSDGWMVVAVTKATGSNTPRAHKVVLGGSASHGGTGSAVSDQGTNALAGGFAIVGGTTSFGWFVGRIAVAGVVNSVLSDADIESLAVSLSNWKTLFTGGVSALWRFDQATATTSDDLTGNGCHLDNVNNTTVVNGDDPPGFLWTDSIPAVIQSRFWPGAGPFQRDRMLWQPGDTTPLADINVAVGQSTETETAQAVALEVDVALGQPSETETAQAVAAQFVVAIGQATETETATAVTVVYFPAQAVETETAQAVTVQTVVAIGQATETESSQAVTLERDVALGQAVETETAQPITAPVGILQATETETAQAVTVNYIAAIAQATETETSQAVTVQRVLVVGQPSETETSQAVTLVRIVPVGQPTEVESAQLVTPFQTGPIFVAIAQAQEGEQAQTIAGFVDVAVVPLPPYTPRGLGVKVILPKRRHWLLNDKLKI